MAVGADLEKPNRKTKGLARTVQKAHEEYGSDYTRVLDFSRISLVCHSLKVLCDALAFLCGHEDSKPTPGRSAVHATIRRPHALPPLNLPPSKHAEPRDSLPSEPLSAVARNGQWLGNFVVKRVKDRLSPSWDPEESYGYSDVLARAQVTSAECAGPRSGPCQ